MRAALEARARRLWAGEGGWLEGVLSRLLVPGELLFRGGVALRNRGYDMGLLSQCTVPAPVISVGNLTVGGTGKTPVAGWIVETLQEAGLRPALVARGYGGDELALHRFWNPDAPVLAAPDRAEGAAHAVLDGADVVVLDDAFQHRRLARDLDLVLLAAEQPLPPRLLPRGPYREPLQALERAHRVLLTRRTAGAEAVDRLEAVAHRAAPGTPVTRVELVFQGWRNLEGEGVSPPSGRVVALASVADPRSFLQMVRRESGVSDAPLLALSDHHDYSESDIRELAARNRGRTLVTTEKDAVKLAPFRERLPDTRVLVLRVEVLDPREELRSQLLEVGGQGRAGGGPRGGPSSTGNEQDGPPPTEPEGPS